MFIAELFTVAKIWNQLRCPSTDKWIKEIWYKYYSVLKMKEILFVTTWMKLEDVMFSKINRTQKSKHYVILLICGV
jgi:hypothetical protein